jgi:single-strand DNA-binding protein
LTFSQKTANFSKNRAYYQYGGYLMAYDSKGTLNKVMLIGRLGADPELKYTASNAAFLNLSVATNTSYKTPDGKVQDNTEWHRVVAWRKIAEAISQLARKGTQIYVEGKLNTRSWEDKDGNKRYTTDIVADNIQLLGGKGDRNNAQENKSAQSDDSPEPDMSQTDSDDSDDLPF